MIALNHLVSNIEKYEQAYKVKGLVVSFDEILDLTEKLKALESSSEEKRATCNKLCAEVLSVRENPQKLSKLLSEITELDASSNSLKQQAKSVERKINIKLKKLHNLPDYIENSDKILSISQNSSKLSDFMYFMCGFSKIDKITQNVDEFLKSISNQLLSENQFPIIKSDYFGNIMILSDENGVVFILNQILSYLSKNSLKFIQVSTKKLIKCASKQYNAYLSDAKISIILCREYHTRESKVKYREAKSDTTKFLNELRLKVTKKR